MSNGFIRARAKRLRGADIDAAGPFGSSVTGTCTGLLASVTARGRTRIRSAALEPEVADLGRLLAPGEGRMMEKHEGHTVTANALVAKRADILFEIGELEKRIEQLRTELAVLVFTPDRLAVVKGGPAVRRAYFDRALGRLAPARGRE